jgi:hypothetical protein
MIDRPSAITRLDQLREQIFSLQTKPRLGEDFKRWHRDVLIALDEIFGPQSPQKREFENIRFEIDPEIIDRYRQRIRITLAEKFHITPPEEFDIPEENYYLRGLHEAADLLLGFKLMIKT